MKVLYSFSVTIDTVLVKSVSFFVLENLLLKNRITSSSSSELHGSLISLILPFTTLDFSLYIVSWSTTFGDIRRHSHNRRYDLTSPFGNLLKLVFSPYLNVCKILLVRPMRHSYWTPLSPLFL